ncbi:MAG: TIGR03118 family protein [Candidatus Binatus sp.]|uniref:TIGR03118 family protein n=1 Tax=Candidatus Binatus sp. TaxID=2811406 RepID=UPI00271C265B|nr:TIGR03118 family protein [Candidatus Binatus sp.]MDO8433835.1 TIGR03118 family protein [Candidatus Binatus sp.]
MELKRRLVSLAAVIALVASIAAEAQAVGYLQTNLVSNGVVPAVTIDPTLKNPWGVAFFPGLSPFWVNDNGSGLSALYLGDGTIFAALPSVIIPSVTGPTGGVPTGIVANTEFASGAFPIGTTGAALFIFATEDGSIQAWSQTIADPTTAVIVVNNSGGKKSAVYKGLALAMTSSSTPQLYATNFRTRRIDVFDATFSPVSLDKKAFRDKKLPAKFAPFGIHNIGGQLWVTYAKQDSAKENDVPGPGRGFVDVFDADGNLVRRFARKGALDAPWGVALAPSTFGDFANDMLIGNFGDGKTNAFDPTTGNLIGPIADSGGTPIVIDGLWSVVFGGALASSADTLFFTAGPNEEADGIFGTLTPK